MERWRKQFSIDPVACLLSSGNEAVQYFVKKDLLDESVEPVRLLWRLPAAQKLLRRQQVDGSWRYPGGGKEHLRSVEHYNQLETYRIMGELVEKYGFTRMHQAVQNAAAFLFQCQTMEGDFRGIYGTQYSPNYSAGIMELLIKAGYGDDPRIEKGFQWLLSLRQDDGGWAIPIRTMKMNYYEALKKPGPIQPDRSKPFSHLITGVVLRAFAAHPCYRTRHEARHAGELLLSRLFQRDAYPDRGDIQYWLRFSYPFWFTDLLSALDSLSSLGFTVSDTRVRSALNWFVHQQQCNGLFDLKLLKTKDKALPYWLCFAVCRVFKRCYV